jgi:hypothetical protein
MKLISYLTGRITCVEKYEIYCLTLASRLACLMLVFLVFLVYNGICIQYW